MSDGRERRQRRLFVRDGRGRSPRLIVRPSTFAARCGGYHGIVVDAGHARQSCR